jgi:hypothetical protein
MITLNLVHYDEETEVAITKAKSGLELSDARKIVRLGRRLRDSGFCEFSPTVRAVIMIARILNQTKSTVGSETFYEACCDILLPRIGKKDKRVDPKIILDDLLAAEGLYYSSKPKKLESSDEQLAVNLDFLFEGEV